MAERAPETVRALNGGHRRRVEIARALLHDPQLLLLDEPTVGLDFPSRKAIVAHVHELAAERDIGILWATHLIDEIRPTDDLIILHKGKVVASGTVDQVVARSRASSLDAAFTALTSGPGAGGMTLYVRAFMGIVWREIMRFLYQRERFLAALVRPLVWLIVFAAGFRAVLGISIIPPYETYITYEVYIVPGLIGMIQLFNGMQSSLSMVYDREMGSMRVLLTTPLPRWFLLVSKLAAGAAVSILQVYAFLLIAFLFGIEFHALGYVLHPAGADPERPDARRGRHVHLLDRAAARKFRRRHEFRDLSGLLPVLRALSALAHAGIERAPLSHLRGEPVHARGRARPLRALQQVRCDRARRRPRLPRRLHGSGGLGLQAVARHGAARAALAEA